MAARAAHIFPALTGSLLSIGMLTDAGLTAMYTAESVTIQDSEGVTVLSGARSPSTRIWMIDFLPTLFRFHKQPHHSFTLPLHENYSQLINFYHATLGSPAISTLLKPRLGDI